MAPKRKYTDEQLAYLKKYYRKYPTKLIAAQLGMTPVKVDSIANYHGLKKNKNRARKPLPEFTTLQEAAAKAMQDAIQAATCNENYGIIMDKQIEKLLDEHVLNLGIYPSCNPERLHAKPHKNWFQRLVLWLLEGKV